MRVPEGSEIVFLASTESYGVGTRFFERKERIHCVVDPHAPIIRITGPSCCGRVAFIEGPLRIVRKFRIRGKGRPGLFARANPKASRGTRTHVFGNLWIGAGGGFPLYVRRCSVHGRYEVIEDTAPADRLGMLRDLAGSFAAMIAAAGRCPDEELPHAVRRVMRAIAGIPDSRQYGFAYAWLRETLGHSEQDIIGSLERIAGLADRPVPASVAGLESRYVFSEDAAWHIAGCIILPAIAAATDSCAEYEVLRNAVLREALRPVEGRRTVWEKALEYVRTAAEVLRNPARYVL